MKQILTDDMIEQEAKRRGFARGYIAISRLKEAMTLTRSLYEPEIAKRDARIAELEASRKPINMPEEQSALDFLKGEEGMEPNEHGVYSYSYKSCSVNLETLLEDFADQYKDRIAELEKELAEKGGEK